jgi:hypothetical protein
VDSLEAYIRGQKPTDYRSLTQFQDLLTQLSAYQTNRAAATALGEEMPKPPRKGLLSWFLGDVVGAPAKAVRGVVFGDPNKTGGDIIKVNEGDSLPEKAAKYAGAFALDIVTDPLSYFGAGTGLGRKAIATSAVELGGKMLDDAIRVAPDLSPAVASRMDDIVDSLFRNSEQYQIAAAGSGDLSLLADDVAPEIKRRLAGDELGRVFGTSLYDRGRKGALDDLERVFGDRELVTHIVRGLGPSFEGGVWLTNPVTGRPWRKLTPGTGELLAPISGAANAARRNIGKYAGRPLKEFQEGRYGGLWQAFKEGVDPVSAVGENLLKGQVTLTAYANTKKLERMMRASKLTRRFGAAGLSIQLRGRMEELAQRSKSEAEDFYAGVTQHYMLPMLEVPPNASELYLEGARFAKQMHDEAYALAEEAYSKGLIANPPKWGYVPTILEKEAKEERILLRARPSGPGAAASSYNPTRSRAEHIVYDPDPKSAALKGTYYDEADGLVALSPLVINQMAKKEKKEFIDDAIRVFETNYDELLGRVLSREFADEAVRRGVVIRDAQSVNLAIQKIKADVYREAIKDVSPQIARRVKEARDAADAALREQLGAKTAETAATQAALRAKTQSDLVASRAIVSDIKKELTEVNRNIVKIRPTAAQAIRRYRRYAQERVEDAVKEGKDAVRNTTKRVTRAQQQADRTSADASARGTVQSVVRDDAAQAALREQQLTLAEQQYELEFARLNRDDVRRSLATEELGVFDSMESLYQRKLQLERDLVEAQRMVEAAATARQSAWAGPDIGAIKNLEDYVFAYVRTRSDLHSMEQKYGFAIREGVADAVDGSRWYEKLLKSPVLAARESITDAVRATYTERRRIAEQAEQELRKVLGIAQAGREGTLLGDYADTLVKLADKMSDADLLNTMIVASDERLTRLLNEFDQAASPIAQDIAAGRIMQVYGTLRKFASKEDIEKLTAAEKALTGALSPDGAEAAMKQVLTAEELRKRGYQPIAPLEPEVTLPRGLENVFVANGTREFLERAYRVESNPTTVKKFMEQTVEPLLLLWKSGVTVLRGPAYTVNNAVGGVMHNYYQGNTTKRMVRDAKFLADMVKIFRQKPLRGKDIYTRLNETQVQLGKKWAGVTVNGMPIVDVLRWYIVNGGAADTQMASIMRRLSQAGGDIEIDEVTGIPVKFTSVNDTIDRADRGAIGSATDRVINFALGNRLSLAAADGNQLVELWLRFTSFAKAYEDYGNLDVALQISDLYHFNYENLSEAERAVRRFVPFYSWTRNNVPLQLRAMFLQPGKIQRFIYAQQEFGKAFGADEDDAWLNEVLPSYIGEAGGFALGLESEAGNLAYASRTPYTDVDRLLRPSAIPVNLRELGNLIGPAALPLQLLSGTNPATGAAFSEQGVEAPGYLKWLQYTGVGRMGKEGEYRLPEPLFYALTESIPFLGTGERAVSGLAELIDIVGAEGAADALRKIPSRQSTEKGLANLLNFTGAGAALGGSFGTLTPRIINSEVRRRNNALNAKLYDYAAKAGVSLEWVKEQLRAGATAEQIQRLIQSGYGRREEYEAQKIAKSRGVSQRSLDIIASLGGE